MDTKLDRATKAFLRKFIRDLKSERPAWKEERRKAIRMQYFTLATVYPISNDTGKILKSQPIRVFSLDISPAGIRMLWQEPCEWAQVVVVLLGGSGLKVALRGNILRSTTRLNGLFEIRAEFIEKLNPKGLNLPEASPPQNE